MQSAEEIRGLARKVRRATKQHAAQRSQAATGVTLGRLIAAERLRQGLSQHDLARAVDCPDAMISHLEAGRRSYWAKLREILEFLAPRAGKVWANQCTKILMGIIDELVWQEADPIRRLMLAEWLRSSGDRAAASSTGPEQGYLPGFVAGLKEPEHTIHRVA